MSEINHLKKALMENPLEKRSRKMNKINLLEKALMEKRAQMQTYETILVVFIFIIILFLGMIIFYKFTAIGLEKEVFEFELEKTYNMIGYFPSLNEVSCSYLGTRKDCMDILKLLNAELALKNLPFYDDKSITVKIIYPSRNDLECSKTNLETCNFINVNTATATTDFNIVNSPVSLYDPVKDRYYVGLLEIRWYK